MSLSWLPNAISIFRIALIPPILFLVADQQFGWALALFFVAGFSDGVDGYLAVRFNWQTRLGGLLDPVADKLMVAAADLDLAREVLATAPVVPGGQWNCTACTEENESNFELCWNCGHVRP